MEFWESTENIILNSNRIIVSFKYEILCVILVTTPQEKPKEIRDIPGKRTKKGRVGENTQNWETKNERRDVLKVFKIINSVKIDLFINF